MKIRRVVSHAIRPAPSPPQASRSTSNPQVPYCHCCRCWMYFVFCLDFVIVFNLFVARQCSFVAGRCTLCREMPRFRKGYMELIVDRAPDSKDYNMKCDFVVLRDASPCS
jgi:hypothetical protein